MTLTYCFARALTKVFFSAVVIQLLFICIGAQQDSFLHWEIIEMLESCAASIAVISGSGYLLEYVIKNT